ncbi:aspartate-semialdehyde dehydrogenase [Pseudomonas helleri]|uniref:aspartate-semialdehyde dehydrogenase n=1 Tax=Pseudomonas helleri TaxID=1608996 RepID=UPI0030D96CD5
MLPPILPLSVVPVTSQQDPVRPRPDIAPVVPAQPSSTDSTINLSESDRERAALLLREEQQRQQDKRRGETQAHQPGDEAGEESEGGDLPSVDGLQRQGVWVDIKV